MQIYTKNWIGGSKKYVVHDINGSPVAGGRWSVMNKNRTKTAILPATARQLPPTKYLKITISTIKSINSIPPSPPTNSDSGPTQVRLWSD